MQPHRFNEAHGDEDDFAHAHRFVQPEHGDDHDERDRYPQRGLARLPQLSAKTVVND